MSLVKLLPARVKEFLLLDPGWNDLLICSSTKVQRNLRSCCNKLEIFEASSRSGRLVSGTVLIFQINKASCFTVSPKITEVQHETQLNAIDGLIDYQANHIMIVMEKSRHFRFCQCTWSANTSSSFWNACQSSWSLEPASVLQRPMLPFWELTEKASKLRPRKNAERKIVFYTGLSGFQTRCSTDENISSLKLHRCFFGWAQAHYALDLLVAKDMDSKMVKVKQIPGGHLLTDEKRLRKYFQVVTDALTMTQFGISFQTWPCDWEMTSTVCVQTRRPSWPKGWFQIVFWWQNGTSKLSYHFIPIEVEP